MNISKEVSEFEEMFWDPEAQPFYPYPGAIFLFIVGLAVCLQSWMSWGWRVAGAVAMLVAVVLVMVRIPADRRAGERELQRQQAEGRWEEEHRTRECVLEAADGSIWFPWLRAAFQEGMNPSAPMNQLYLSDIAERVRAAGRLCKSTPDGDLAILAPVFFFAKEWLESCTVDGFLMIRLSNVFFEEIVYPYWREKEAHAVHASP
ncbi:hypothetical protein L0Y40_02925 [Candidatus Wolfebacteria bacterium]|nr:hypothetical protein [Candidatus Wolfebacteria bacterium]